MPSKWDIQENGSCMSNISMKPLSPIHTYTCNLHYRFFRQHLCPTRRMTKRCIECLKKTVHASVSKNQFVTLDYNYIFPMLCDICAVKLKTCKWCRPSDHKFSMNYDDTFNMNYDDKFTPLKIL